MAGRKNGAPISLLDDATDAGVAGFGQGTAAMVDAACKRFFERKGMSHGFGGATFGRSVRDPAPSFPEPSPTPTPTPNTVTTTMPTEPDQEMATCPECGETVKRRGLGVHRARAHGFRKAKLHAHGVPLSQLVPVVPSRTQPPADNIDSLVQRVKQAKADLDAAKTALLAALGV